MGRSKKLPEKGINVAILPFQRVKWLYFPSFWKVSSGVQGPAKSQFIIIRKAYIMHDELTAVDIKKMQEEIDYRMCVLRPQLLAEVQRTREFGDLSENAEYKEAKREKNKNESRIRYLKNMIATAKVVKVRQQADAVCLFDTVSYYIEEDDEIEERQIVTTLRQDILKGYLSKESPLGKALLGKKVGDRVLVRVNDNYSYYVEIREIKKDTTTRISRSAHIN